MPDVLAILASSAALALSEVPFPKPVAAVRVGLIEERRPERPAPAAATDDAVSDGAASDDAGAGAGAGAAEEDDFLDELILDEQVTSEISEISEISVISSDCLPHQL
jgi:polyribonucleotide nucleotidyltransferase